MPFNFEVINKQRYWGQRMPDDIIRLTKNTLAFGESTSAKLGTYADPSSKATGHLKFRVGIAYDDHKQAIRLYPRKDGFRVDVNPDNGFGSFNMPKGLLDMHPPRGDYRLVDGETDIYQLSR